MRDALAYPLAGDAEDRFLGGWILHLLHALVLPALPLVVVVGHLAGVTRAAATGAEPPLFRGWRTLAADTGRTLVVLAAYGVPSAATLYLGALVLPSETNVSAVPIALLAGGLLGILLPLAYSAPASVAHAAVSRSLRAGFDPSAVGPTLRDARYFTRWAGGVAALAVGVGFAAWLGEYLVGYLLAFYCEVLAAACFGWGAATTTSA
ncbi:MULTISPECIES: DUF4013 domain-containing protein [Halobacterium]|uniref:DUF4013 domain-containing protein n=1 Tax=Halobacterium TaxID=2239 RepID=UPI00073F2820|nr:MULTISPECIES: DUF4013 domain-containing protein [Halobacterium]MCG1003448.1 DUF4013 domain-containing protein [Halobacterium noricense]